MKRLLVVMLLAGCKIEITGGTGGGSAGGGTAGGGTAGGTTGTGGGGSTGGSSGGSSGGGTAQQPAQPPNLDTLFFAAAGTGANKLLAEVGNARLEFDPTTKDALTALAQCADLISYCYAPGAFSVSDCFARTRKCATTQPWNEQPCCPSECATAFDGEVDAGLGHVQALEKVLFREPDCFPGVRAALESP